MQPATTALATTPDAAPPDRDTPAVPAPTEAGQAALDAARALGRRTRDAAGLQGGLNALRRLVRCLGVCPGARRARDRRHLPGQPEGQLRANHHPPLPGSPGQDAPAQRPALRSRALRHPGAAAGPAARARPPGAEGHGPHPAPAAPAPCGVRPHRPRPARPRAAADRLRRRAPPLRAGSAAGRGRGRRPAAAPAARQDGPGGAERGSSGTRCSPAAGRSRLGCSPRPGAR